MVVVRLWWRWLGGGGGGSASCGGVVVMVVEVVLWSDAAVCSSIPRAGSILRTRPGLPVLFFLMRTLLLTLGGFLRSLALAIFPFFFFTRVPEMRLDCLCQPFALPLTQHLCLSFACVQYLHKPMMSLSVAGRELRLKGAHLQPGVCVHFLQHVAAVELFKPPCSTTQHKSDELAAEYPRTCETSFRPIEATLAPSNEVRAGGMP